MSNCDPVGSSVGAESTLEWNLGWALGKSRVCMNFCARRSASDKVATEVDSRRNECFTFMLAVSVMAL